ncbi:MAG: PHB depolymerase family esterase [Pseudomonadota bacterium]
MRFLALMTIILGGAMASPAQANCDIGGRAVPCATKNGYYRIAKPPGPGPHPAVMYLYGSLGNSGDLIGNRGFVQAFVDRGYAVIVPAGLNLRYRSGIGSGWFLRNARTRKDRNDAAFVAEVLADAAVKHRIDRKRVLMAGMSNGGFLTWEIACHNPDMAAAYAPIAAGYLGKMPKKCRKPVRIIHTHGRADQVVTVDESGDRFNAGARIATLGETLGGAARAAGCTHPGKSTKFKEYDRTTWNGCQRGASVDLLLHDGGHTIPLSWYSLILDWFEGPGTVTNSVGGGTARFQGVSEGESRFQRAGQGTGRFKRATTPSE